MKPIPERIARQAGRRIAEASASRSKVEDAVQRHRPLDAEENEERKLNYIQKRVGVRRETAARIANYEDPNTLLLTGEQRSRAEAIQGTTVDFLPISFMPVGRAASRSVARVAFRNRNPQGTGFMVSPRLFLTNQHVVNDENDARNYYIEFEHELDVSRRERQVTRFAIDTTFFLFDPEDDLDFALMAVGPKIDGPRELADFGFLPLLDTPDKHIKGVFVNVIQHPSGRPKELVIRENRIVERTPNTLIYGSDTLPGSSGSPVFNDDWEVVALHHYGAPFRARVDNNRLPVHLAGNEGIRISSIVAHLRAELPRLSPARAALLRQALNPPFRQPSLTTRFVGNEDLEVPAPSDTVDTPRGGTTVSNDGTVSVILPLGVSFRLGGLPGIGAGAPPSLEPTTPPPVLPPIETPPSSAFEAIFTPDPNYSNRRGYNRKFLGPVVEMPRLSNDQRKIAARNLNAKQGDDPFELKYQHFSIVMNGRRRVAFFTASNIDGGSVVKINRKTGIVTSVESLEDRESMEEAEASEKWYDDSRVDPKTVSNQKLYSSDDFRGVFHRGHLVKRTDPSWGGEDKARRGQADTFHFTNCAPQHKSFNPVRTRWAGIEDWITNGSDDTDLRVTVFTGSVFRNDDPVFDTIRVPREFWKVIVRIEEGELLATAVLADQSDLLAQHESLRSESGGAEDLPDFPDHLPDEYQVTIAHLEQLTGLDFGPLRDRDTFAPGPEAAGDRRKIQSFQDISIRRPPKEMPPNGDRSRSRRSK